MILKLLTKYETYKDYRHFIPKYEDKVLVRLYDVLDIMMKESPQDYTLDDLFIKTSITFPKDQEQLAAIYESIKNVDLTETTVNSLLSIIRERAWASELGEVAFGVGEGRRPIEDISRIYERYGSLQEELTVKQFVTDDLEELYETTVKSPGLRWRLESLNRSLGSLRKGNFGFIFARPETGKTTFLASEITCFAKQSSTPGIWFNNEQPGNEVALRCYQGCLGLPIESLLQNRSTIKQQYLQETKGHLRIYDDSSIHRRDVEKLCEIYKPSFLVFDQIDKLKGFSDDREDLRLGSIYIWARELAKKYCPVIAVCQAAASGEGKRWLEMDDVANAKTAKQAEADWILGIGKTHEDGMDFVRHFHLIKNKLLGDEDTDPTMRHGKWDVIIEVTKGRYRDI